ncbi:phiSA1p31-related protein [Streptomyces rubiginosohelvolus]|uniref:phiSA1p31-related protein n=1 Tax=Streptomyces rubiginosohelvolus TaxID=67362 RepID=UPI00365BF44F
MSETFTFEGIEFDLEIAYRDVTGVEWQWSGERTPEGLPLMWECSHKSLSRSTITFPDLYWEHGPLIPVRELSGEDFRAAIDPNYAATVAAGYVESSAAFGVRITPATAPAPALTAHHLNPSPMEQTGFRRFLNSIAGGNR